VFSLRRRVRAEAAEAQFCETCSQVCTPTCQAEAHRERARVQAAQWLSTLR
jgi:hypothetical protein